MKTANRWRVGSLLLVVLVCSTSSEATKSDADSWTPRGLRITPNAIQTRDEPLLVEARGQPGAQAWIFVLRDCNGDGRPDATSHGTCKSPVKSWSIQVDANGALGERVDFRKHPDIPENVPLWLSVCSGPTPKTHCGDALFGLVKDACGLFSTLVDMFASGPCNPRLHRILGGRRAVTESAAQHEIAWVDTSTRGLTIGRVPDSRGATGVTWEGPRTLVATWGPESAPAETRKAQGPRRSPGLYRLGTDGHNPRLLWRAPKGVTPGAPLVLDKDRIAFAQERRVPGAAPTFSLMIWSRRRLREIPVDRPIRNLYPSDKRKKAVVARAPDVSGFTFLHIELDTGKVTNLGFSGALLHALHRAPGRSGVAAVDYEDVANDGGWEVALVNAQGEGVREISVGPGDAHSPSWSPDGRRLAFLLEHVR